MHGDVGAIPRELKGDRAAEAGRRSRDEGLQAGEIALLSRHHPLLIADFSLRKGSNASCAIRPGLSVIASHSCPVTRLV